LITCILVEITLKISHFCTFQTSVTLDRVIWHTVVYHSSTSNYILNFVQIGKTFCGQTLRPALLGRLGGVDPSRPNNWNGQFYYCIVKFYWIFFSYTSSISTVETTLNSQMFSNDCLHYITISKSSALILLLIITNNL